MHSRWKKCGGQVNPVDEDSRARRVCPRLILLGFLGRRVISDPEKEGSSSSCEASGSSSSRQSVSPFILGGNSFLTWTSCSRSCSGLHGWRHGWTRFEQKWCKKHPPSSRENVVSRYVLQLSRELVGTRISIVEEQNAKTLTSRSRNLFPVSGYSIRTNDHFEGVTFIR